MTLIMTPQLRENMYKPRKLETYFPVTKNEGEIKAYLGFKNAFGIEVWVYPETPTFAFNADSGGLDLRGNYPTWYEAMIAGIEFLKIEYKGEYKHE